MSLEYVIFVSQGFTFLISSHSYFEGTAGSSPRWNALGQKPTKSQGCEVGLSATPYSYAAHCGPILLSLTLVNRDDYRHGLSVGVGESMEGGNGEVTVHVSNAQSVANESLAFETLRVCRSIVSSLRSPCTYIAVLYRCHATAVGEIAQMVGRGFEAFFWLGIARATPPPKSSRDAST